MQPGIATYTEVNGQTMALNRIAVSMLAIAATITLLGGQLQPSQHSTANQWSSPDTLKEQKHGLVEGYHPPLASQFTNCCQLHPKPSHRLRTGCGNTRIRFRCGDA